MDNNFVGLFHDAWRVLGLVFLPSLLIAAIGGGFALVQGLLGFRDEGLTYAVRIVVLVALGSLLVRSVGQGFVSLMTTALR